MKEVRFQYQHFFLSMTLQNYYSNNNCSSYYSNDYNISDTYFIDSNINIIITIITSSTYYALKIF